MLPVDPAKFSAFLVAMLLMALSVGPAVMFCIRTGLSGHRSHVVAAAIGINSATLVWFVGSAIGLQALMLAFPLAFQLLAIAGGVYVGWIGFCTVRDAWQVRSDTPDAPLVTVSETHVAKATFISTLREGFWVQMLNPKVLIFFSAVLPPFVDIDRPMPMQMAVFAATAVAIDSVAFLGYGLTAFTLSQWLSHPRNRRLFDLCAGAALMLIAAAILWHGLADLFSPH